MSLNPRISPSGPLSPSNPSAGTWAQVLINGAISGGVSPVISSGDQLLSEDGTPLNVGSSIAFIVNAPYTQTYNVSSFDGFGLELESDQYVEILAPLLYADQIRSRVGDYLRISTLDRDSGGNSDYLQILTGSVSGAGNSGDIQITVGGVTNGQRGVGSFEASTIDLLATNDAGDTRLDKGRVTISAGNDNTQPGGQLNLTAHGTNAGVGLINNDVVAIPTSVATDFASASNGSVLVKDASGVAVWMSLVDLKAALALIP